MLFLLNIIVNICFIPAMSNGLNGFTTEDDSRGGHDQICCLIDTEERCVRSAGNASYSKRIQKTVQQRRLKLIRDDSVRAAACQATPYLMFFNLDLSIAFCILNFIINIVIPTYVHRNCTKFPGYVRGKMVKYRMVMNGLMFYLQLLCTHQYARLL